MKTETKFKLIRLISAGILSLLLITIGTMLGWQAIQDKDFLEAGLVTFFPYMGAGLFFYSQMID